jgi:hypothetical protein
MDLPLPVLCAHAKLHPSDVLGASSALPMPMPMPMPAPALRIDSLHVVQGLHIVSLLSSDDGTRPDDEIAALVRNFGQFWSRTYFEFCLELDLKVVYFTFVFLIVIV